MVRHRTVRAAMGQARHKRKTDTVLTAPDIAGQEGRGFVGEVIVNANRLHAMAKQQPANTLNEHELSQDFEFGCKVWTMLRQLLRAYVCKCMVSAASAGGLMASLCDDIPLPRCLLPPLLQPGWTFKPVRQVEAQMSIRLNYKAR